MECVAVEDSGAGIRSAAAAGMVVVAVPNRAYPPEPEVVASVGVVLDSLHDLDPGAIERAASRC